MAMKLLVAAVLVGVVAAAGIKKVESSAASATDAKAALNPAAAKIQSHVSLLSTLKKAHAEKSVASIDHPHRRASAAAHHEVAAAASKKAHVKAAAVHEREVVDEDDAAAELDTTEGSSAPVAAAAASLASQQDGADDSDDVTAPLAKELDEMKESRANIGQLEDALRADVSLLRESAKMQRVAHSRRAREAAAKQTKRSEQLVKVTSAMIKESRATASAGARRALRHSGSAKAAAEALAAEADADLKMLEPAGATPRAAAAEPPAAQAEEKDGKAPSDADDDEEASL